MPVLPNPLRTASSVVPALRAVWFGREPASFWELAPQSLTRLPALRRRAVRDAFASAFAQGLSATAFSSLVVAALFGITLLQFVLPLLPWVGSRPQELARLFLFTVQHVGDVLAGVLVIGQAGLAATWELSNARTSHRFLAASAAGMDPVELFVLPRVWALALVYLVIGMLFKVSAVTIAAFVSYMLDGGFLGPEIGIAVETSGQGILAGYALNLILAGFLAATCCAPFRPGTGASTNPLTRVFRQALVLLLAGKLLYFLL